MSRGKKGVFASVAAVALMVGSAPVSADHHLIGAVDNIAPEPVTGLSASADLLTSTATVTWTLSASDAPGVSYTGGGNANASAANTIASNDVTEYIINAIINSAAAVEVARVPAGTTSYDDDAAEAGDTRSYQVIATDGPNNSAVVTSNTVTFGDPPNLVFDLAPGTHVLSPVGLDECTGIDFEVTNEGAGDGFLTLASDIPPGFEILLLRHLDVEPVELSPGTQLSIDSEGFLDFSILFCASLVGNVNRTYEGIFTFTTNQVGNEVVVYEVTATVEGGVSPAQLDVVGDRLTFVDVPLDGSLTQTLTVLNVGGLDLTADLALTGDSVFDISGADIFTRTDDDDNELTSVNVTANSSATVDVTFTPDVSDGEYSGLITITSVDDPAAQISFTLAGTEGTVTPDNPVEAPAVEITLTLSADVAPEIFVAGSPENLAFVELARTALAAQMGIDPSRIIITAIEAGSTEVTFQILDPPEDDVDAPSAAEAATALETIVADEPEVLVTALEDATGEELGVVDAIASEAIVIVIQPIDSEGGAIAGWFTRAGTRVDLDDFFEFADAFGSSLGEPSFASVFDISGSDLVPDGVVNFDDFFRFADDFGKTVANAAEIQAITLGG